MKSVQISVQISQDEYLKWYQGNANSVLATTAEGKRVRFPANILRPFVTRDGIKGTFLITFDDNNRFHNIARLR